VCFGNSPEGKLYIKPLCTLTGLQKFLTLSGMNEGYFGTMLSTKYTV